MTTSKQQWNAILAAEADARHVEILAALGNESIVAVAARFGLTRQRIGQILKRARLRNLPELPDNQRKGADYYAKIAAERRKKPRRRRKH